MAHRPAFLVSLLLLAFVRAQRIATVHEVQPSSRDVVHSVWVNGPAFSAKLPSGASSAWPQFQAGVATRAGSQCSRDDTRYTGYDDSGLYCEAASPALDENAHLLLYSGRLGVVVDAEGLAAQASSNTRNLFPKLGALGGTARPREAYNALSAVATSITLDVTCSSGTATYVLGTSTEDSYVQVGLVRQGHAVTQVTLSGLEFQSATSGGVFGPCESFSPEQQSDAAFAAAVGRRLTHTSNHHCNQDHGGASHPCPSSDFPNCVGFVQGASWGKCYSVCTASGAHPNLWGELSIWGDSVAFELAWDTDFTLSAGCTGSITVAIGSHTSTTALPAGSGRRLSQPEPSRTHRSARAQLASQSALLAAESSSSNEDSDDNEVPDFDALDHALHFPRLSGELERERSGARKRGLQAATGGGSISLLLTVANDGSLVVAQPAAQPLAVTSAAGRWVLARPNTGDVFVEVPTSVGTCNYNTQCAALPLSRVDVVATNPHPTEQQTLRLSFSRNFEVRDSSLAQSSPQAEITGLSGQLWVRAAPSRLCPCARDDECYSLMIPLPTLITLLGHDMAGDFEPAAHWYPDSDQQELALWLVRCVLGRV